MAGTVFRDGGGSGWAFGGGGEWVWKGTAPMPVGLRAVAVTHAPAFDGQSVDYFNVASAFAVPDGDISPLEQPHVADQADAPFFVGQIWPYHVVEDVLLDGIDRGRQGSDLLGEGRVLEGGGVDGESREMVQVRVSDEIGRDQIPQHRCSIRLDAFRREDETSEWASSHDERWLRRIPSGRRGWSHALGIRRGRHIAGLLVDWLSRLRVWEMLFKDLDDCGQMGAAVDGENGSFAPVRGQ